MDVTSPHPGAYPESPRTKDALITEDMPRGTGTQNKDQMLQQKMLLYSYHLGNSKGFRASVPGTRTETNICFLYCLTVIIHLTIKGCLESNLVK